MSAPALAWTALDSATIRAALTFGSGLCWWSRVILQAVASEMPCEGEHAKREPRRHDKQEFGQLTDDQHGGIGLRKLKAAPARMTTAFGTPKMTSTSTSTQVGIR